MIKLHALKIDVVATLGKRYWLTEVRPVYKYIDNKKTDEIDGYRYTIVLPERGLEKISVKIEGKKRIDTPDNYVEVDFSNLELYIYWLSGQPQIGARAKDIHLAMEVVE